MVRRRGGLPLASRHAALPVRIGLNHAGINREALAADQPFGHTAPYGRLKHLAQQVALVIAALLAIFVLRPVIKARLRDPREAFAATPAPAIRFAYSATPSARQRSSAKQSDAAA
jgi:hypothetical protein